MTEKEKIDKILFAINVNLGLNKVQLADLLGVNPQAISKWSIRKKIPNSSKISLHNQKGVSLSFLDTGEGPFFESEEMTVNEPTEVYRGDITKNKQSENVHSDVYNIEPYELPKNITHIPVAAEAGIIGGSFDAVRQYETISWAIPELHGNCYSFVVKGDSMEATMVEGEMIITTTQTITSVHEIANDYIYAIVTRDNILIKRVNRHIDPELIWLVSDNDDYDEVELHFSEIIAMYRGRRILKHQLDQKLRYD